MHLISRHSDEHAGAEGAAGAKQLFESARRTFNKLRLTAFAVCSLYSIGFTSLTASYFTSLSASAAHESLQRLRLTCASWTATGGLPHVCRSLVGTLSVFRVLEGVFSGVVAVGFTLYAFTFNGLVYAVLAKRKRVVEASARSCQETRSFVFFESVSAIPPAPARMPHPLLPCTMCRFIPAAWRPSAFITAGATEQRRLSLSRLGSKLSVVSVFSFACKAALTALDFYGVSPQWQRAVSRPQHPPGGGCPHSPHPFPCLLLQHCRCNSNGQSWYFPHF